MSKYVEIYIWVRGGVVQAVRGVGIPKDATVTVFDYEDVQDARKNLSMTNAEAEYELYGESWEEVEKKTVGVY